MASLCRQCLHSNEPTPAQVVPAAVDGLIKSEIRTCHFPRPSLARPTIQGLLLTPSFPLDWQHPQILLLALPALALLLWFDARTTHPMSMTRRRILLVVRSLLVLLALAALASPALVRRGTDRAAILVLDHSRSMGEEGLARVYEKADSIRKRLPSGIEVGYLAAGEDGRVLASVGGEAPTLSDGLARMNEDGAQSNYASAVELAAGLFPSGAGRHVILVGDGLQTQGDLDRAARQAAAGGMTLHAAPVAGEARPDVRVTRLESSQARLSEGATLQLTAHIEASIAAEAQLRLFENGIEVETRDLVLKPGEPVDEVFTRTPDTRNAYTYRAVLGQVPGDTIPENNEALALVDVQGKPLLLYIEGEQSESSYLVDAMAREGIRLEVRNAEGIPQTLGDLVGYDGIILSDVAARKVPDATMTAIRDYVEKLGGGLVMIGGMNSFGVGGYHRTPLEEVLPVKLKAPDQEEQQSAALALVIDRSGSMSGQKIEVCKSAAIATAELLGKKDSIGVYAFDSQVHVVVPMTRVSSTSAIAAQIATLNSGGGTFIEPGMVQARADLGKVRAKIKHMIVLTDGQTTGQGYEALAAQCRAEGITISTVAVGAGAQIGLLQGIASAGGGQSYVTMDPSQITKIFTQDTMVHTGKMIREEAFQPQQNETHPMLAGIDATSAPPLLGYVKTIRRTTAQVPLITDSGDPLLAHWRYGLGKVTAFTSDCKTRWASLWVTRWPGYSQLWAQVLRETARPPQGQLMDLRVERQGERTTLAVDVLQDAGSRKNDAKVEADIFFVSPNALGSTMKPLETLRLSQTGPGLYTGDFDAAEAGVYLVRARTGAQMVSAGIIHNPSSEVASGQVDEDLFRRATELTGGTLIKADGSGEKLTLSGSDTESLTLLWPLLMKIFLGLLLLDVAIRRWENVRGMAEVVGLAK